jgi:hypothetical protein
LSRMTCRQGLYRTVDVLVGDCAFTHWGMGDAHPFVPKEIYDAIGFEPRFDSLPTQAEYELKCAESH